MKNRNSAFTTIILLALVCFALSSATQGAPSPTNVNVVNTPSVNVINTTASPVLVRDVDNPARQPFHAHVTGGFADGASTTGPITITTVPAGKLLVIEHVSAFGRMLPFEKMVRFTIRYGIFSHSVVCTPQGSSADGSRDYFVVSELVRFYDDNDGLPMQWEAERDSTTGANPTGVDVDCDGYLVDCPTCAQ